MVLQCEFLPQCFHKLQDCELSIFDTWTKKTSKTEPSTSNKQSDNARKVKNRTYIYFLNPVLLVYFT